MKFSIVITTYNRVKWLRQAIASAQAQTVPCEIVVVDDCSTDSTQTYVESLGNSVIYHRNSTNLGHSASVNAGVERSTGDWIKFLDDDDYLAPDCIEKMIGALAPYPQAALCSCQAVQVDTQGQAIGRTQAPFAAAVHQVDQQDIHYQMLKEQLPFGTPVQVAARRDAFLASGGWDAAFSGNCDDIESWIKIAQYGDAVILSEALAYRTIWPGNCSSQLSLRARMQMNVVIKEKIYARIHSKYHQALPALSSITAFLQLHWGLVGLKRGRLVEALQLVTPVLLSWTAWKYLAQVLYNRLLLSGGQAALQIVAAMVPSRNSVAPQSQGMAVEYLGNQV